MEIEIEGIDKFASRIDAMIQNIDNFGKTDMPAELTNWQAEDMKRHFPETETPDDKTATTEIFPRSRVPSQHKRPSGTARLVPLARPKGASGVRPISTRPILRSELYTSLVKRMSDLLEKSLSWASASRP
jgi:hypothetical protein